MPQPPLFGPDNTPTQIVLSFLERPYLDGGGVTVEVRVATRQHALTTFEVFPMVGYEVDYLGTLAERLALAWLMSEDVRTLRRIVKRTLKEAKAHNATHDSTR